MRPGGRDSDRSWRRLLRWPTRTQAQIARDVDDELRFHLEMREQELRSYGRSADEAAREARARFGDVDAARRALRQTEHRAQRRSQWRDALGALRADVAYAVRRTLRAPLFTLTTVATLGVGIGATVALASVMRRMLIAPLPYPGVERLVVVSLASRDGSIRVSMNPTVLEAAREATPSLERIETIAAARKRTVRGGAPATIDVGLVSRGLLQFLHVAPALGRSFAPDEEGTGGAPVAMLAWHTWQRDFGGRASAIGETVTLDGRSYAIIGVMPRLFDPSVFALIPRAELWLPHLPARSDNYLAALGVLRPGATLAQVTRDVAAAKARLGERDPMRSLVPMIDPLLDRAGSETRRVLQVMLAAVLLVLVIGCLNVANLLLARGATRERELSIRTAIGASRGRIMRQLLTESAWLALLGAVAGAVLARALLALARGWRPVSYAAVDDVQLDGTMLALAVLLAACTAVLFGLIPALVNSRGLGGTLHGGARSVGPGRAGQQVRRSLAFLQVAGSVALVVGGVILVQSAWTLSRMRLGYDVAPLLTIQLQRVPGIVDSAAIDARVAPVLERVRAHPGVVAAALADGAPGGFGGCLCEILREGDAPPVASQERFVLTLSVDSAYLQTVGTRLLAGRVMARDTALREVMLTATSARRLWPAGDAVGRRLRLTRTDPLFTVVGVIEDQRSAEGWIPGDSMTVVLPRHGAGDGAVLVVRARGDVATLRAELVRLIEEVSPTVRVAEATSLAHDVAEGRAPQRFARILLVAFACCALLLATLGLYGVLSFGVAQRTREIGVRMALGASRSAIVHLVMSEGMLITIAGCLVGGAVAWSGRGLLLAMRTGASASDDVWGMAIAVSLVAVASAAAMWVPTRRALRVDPATAVGAEV
ncbi:MAG: ABC transporter permease [Gemmatimonadetes bacterium]|nr:ABC transporter permease [Gemmatimonadota bacterium]